MRFRPICLVSTFSLYELAVEAGDIAHLALGKEGKLAHLRSYKEHCGAILAGCHACTATDAGRRVHGDIGNLLRDGEVVCVRSSAAVERYIAACLLNLVEGVAVDHEVANHGESEDMPQMPSRQSLSNTTGSSF